MKNPFSLIELVWWTHSRRKQNLKSMLDALGTRLKLLRKQSIKSMANAHDTTRYAKNGEKTTTKPQVKGTKNTRHNHGLI